MTRRTKPITAAPRVWSLNHFVFDPPFTVEERTNSVRVTIADIVFHEGDAEPACATGISVSLTSPIGDRTVVDVRSKTRHKVQFLDEMPPPPNG